MNKIERIAEVRGINAEKRTAEFVISTESIDKIELFLISRDYSMTDRIQAPRDS